MSKPAPLVKDNWKFYTLGACAYSCLEDIQEDESQFNRFLHFAMEGYREFHFDMSHQLETVELPMPAWKQIHFPINMVDWVRLGFWDGDMIRVLTRDPQNNIPKLHKKDAQGNLLENKPSADMTLVSVTSDLVPFFGWGNYFGNPTSDRFYGASESYNYLGYFDVDLKNRVFNFKQTVDKFSSIYLEYISDGINYNGRTLINPLAFKLIKLYVHWQRKENDDRYSLGEKDRAEKLYNKQRMLVALRMLNLSIDTIREILRSGYGQVVQN